MARESRIEEDYEELSVAADPWNVKLELAVRLDTRFTRYTFTHFSSRS